MIINRHHISSPSQIIDLKLGIPLDYKQECINEIYKIGNSIDEPSNVYGIRSTYEVWKETEVLNLLLGNIESIINNLYKDKFQRRYFSITEAWSIIYKKGHNTNPHEHLPFTWAFVYYLQSNGDTPLIFNDCNFSLNPTDDSLIIFPAYLVHSVPPHEGGKDRICVAGNVDTKKIIKHN